MIIAITNQKGGVGKTTTAINLAAAFARRGTRTLLLDLDLQFGDLAGLGEAERPVGHQVAQDGHRTRGVCFSLGCL